MSLSLNKVIYAGRICNDIEPKQTQSGISVVNFRMAVQRKLKPDEADFFEVQAWRGTADFITKYFTKGMAICVAGSNQQQTWEDKNGNKHSTIVLIADEVNFVESKQAKSSETTMTELDPNEDGLPF